MNCDLVSTIPDWLIEYPHTAPVFAEFQLDTCCGGKSLEYVCRQQGIDPQVVLQRLRRAVDASPPGCGGETSF